jgi:hypothetical protein
MIAAAWRVVGAEVAATVGTGVEVVHTCRVEMEIGLHLKTYVILLLFVRYSKVLISKQY